MNGFYTTRGLDLAAKIAAGTAPLTIKRITAGSGTTRTSDTNMKGGVKQTLAAGAPTVSGQTVVLPATLAEVKSVRNYTLTELGVWANDPDVGDILFQVFRLRSPQIINTGGTAVYRFYLNQSIGNGTIYVSCSPEGLVMEEDLSPIRDMVMATTSGGGVHSTAVDADGLIEMVEKLPRMLTKNHLITVKTGTIAQKLVLSGFYGPGELVIEAAFGHEVALTGGCSIERCSAHIGVRGLHFTGGKGSENSPVGVRLSPCVKLYGCLIDAQNLAAPYFGLKVDDTSKVHVSNCTLKNAVSGALKCTSTSFVTLEDCTGSGNVCGIEVSEGGAVFLNGRTPETMGGSFNNKFGGLIVNSSGQLI